MMMLMGWAEQATLHREIRIWNRSFALATMRLESTWDNV
jgi:hypothetical protein